MIVFDQPNDPNPGRLLALFEALATATKNLLLISSTTVSTPMQARSAFPLISAAVISS